VHGEPDAILPLLAKHVRSQGVIVPLQEHATPMELLGFARVPLDLDAGGEVIGMRQLLQL
jgi:hypothetical protein